MQSILLKYRATFTENKKKNLFCRLPELQLEIKQNQGVRYQIKRRNFLALEDYLPIKAQSHPPLCD
jgi:hypothetical protein